jgi:hypothetical protein
MTPLVAPLCPGSDILVKDFNLDYFISKINNKEYFSFWKINHGHWEQLYSYFVMLNGQHYTKNENSNKNNIAPKQISDSDLMGYCKWAVKRSHSPLFGASWEELYKVISLIHSVYLNGHPSEGDDYIFALSDGSHRDYTSINDNLYSKFKKYYVHNIHDVIRASIYNQNGLILCKNNLEYEEHLRFVPARGNIFKKAYRGGILTNLFDAIQGMRILYVGPGKIDNEKYPHIDAIKIPSSRAIMKRDNTLSEIKAWCEMREHESIDQIIFFCCGYTQVYLIHTLHKMYSNTFLIDVGQSLDPLIKKNHTTKPWEVKR